MMNFADYEVKLPYPNKKDFTNYTLLDVKNVSVVIQENNVDNFIKKLRNLNPNFNTVSESTMFKFACKHGYAIGKNFDEDAYTVTVEEYRKAVKRCSEQFDSDLFEENGVTNNPKANLLLEKCLTINDYGRNYQLVETFEELVDLIKD